ncbi:MAG: hypothetical protein K2X35_16070 [Bryobacteraceae bacterium]|nr:hypothetical protein [Bryobacteraceae bacterium]
MRLLAASVLLPILLAAQARHTHTNGLSVAVPAGWTAQDGPNGILLVPPGTSFDPNGEEIYAVGFMEGYSSLADPKLARDIQQGIASGTAAGRQGAFQDAAGRAGKWLQWQFNHPQTGVPVTVQVYLTSAGGAVFGVTAIGATRLVARNLPAIERAATTMAYGGQQARSASGSVSDGAAASQAWLQRLRGRQLIQMSSSQYHTSKKVLTLNADGTFTFWSNSLASINVGEYGQAPSASAMSANRGAADGRWRVITRGGQAYLELKTREGVAHYELSSEGAATYLDGVRTYVQ